MAAAITASRAELQGVMKANALSRARVADLLGVSTHTVDAWLKPATSSSSNPVPKWAVELLVYKCSDPKLKA